MRRKTMMTVILMTATLWSSVGFGAHKWLLKEGTPDLKSAGQLAFGPDGILFVGDAKGGAVFAVDTGDAKAGKPSEDLQIDNLTARLIDVLGSDEVAVNDLAVNPISKSIYLSVSQGSDKTPALVRIDAAGNVEKISLDNVPFLKATLPNVPEDKITGEGKRAKNRRDEAITDLAYVDGKVLVSGLTNDAAPSNVRSIAFPFAESATGANIEFYHGAHGRSEDYAAVRTFVPFNIDGEPTLLAGFTCTPLVRFSLDNLTDGGKAVGTTVAELGNRNMPLDMIVYEQGGERFLLMANNNRGVMKISTQDIGRKEGITAPVKDGGTAGQKFETIEDLNGTVQLDRLNDELGVIIQSANDQLQLRTVKLP
ncbi:MAG: hypothetical protein WEB58_13190 [Planctomycetaceae bacterium]